MAPDTSTGTNRRGPARRWLARVVTSYRWGVEFATRALEPWLDLYIRLWLAQTFFVSGLLKLGNWDNALALARYEYPVSWMDPVSAAYLGAGIELVAPVLLALGLATRAAAAALLGLTLVVQFNYQVLDTHLLWAALFAWLVMRGAGALSLDRVLARGLVDSALPGAAALLKAAARVTRHGEPVYVLALRVWLSAGLLSAVFPDAAGRASGLVIPTLGPFSDGVGIAAALLLGAGLALRPAAFALVALAFGMEVMDPGRLDTTHYLILVLLGLGLCGARRWSLDALLNQALRHLPDIEGGVSFSPEGMPRVVIVGAGFGGMACARGLRHAPVAITLIDRHNYHLFQPLLYQVATTALAPGDIAMPIRSLLRDQHNAQVLLGQVTAVDTAHREVLLGQRRIPYDHLVLATGASHSYFGRDDWGAYAPGLKRIEDATDIRSRLLLAFEQAEAAEDPDEREALLTFLIVGAGPTGVELAGAIAELARFGMEKEFRHLDPANARVVLVQSGPRILPTFPENLSARAEAALRDLGVEVLTGSRVEEIDSGGVRIGGTPMIARTVFWAAGVVASPAARWLGAEADRSGRVKVEADLTAPGLPEVFVIGDTALSNAWSGQPVPGLGPAAKQAGTYAARVIAARVAGRPVPRPFRYHHLGSLATIGRKAAVADFGFLRLSGALAWWLWGLVHVYFLAGMRNRVSVMLDWAWAYFTFRSSTRLITGAAAAPSVPETTPPEPGAQRGR